MAVCFFCFAACGGEAPKADDTNMAKKEESAPKKVMVKKSMFSSSPEFPGAKLELAGYEKGTFNFNVSNYELAAQTSDCLLYTSPSPRDRTRSRMPSSA